MKQFFIKDIRILIINTLSTTALSILLMCLAALLQGHTLWGVTISFEMLLVNFLMHIGFLFIRKIDLKNNIFNYIIMLIYLIGLIICFGFIFNWFHANAIWIICLVGVVVFILAFIFDIIRFNHDAIEINNKLKKIQQRK